MVPQAFAGFPQQARILFSNGIFMGNAAALLLNWLAGSGDEGGGREKRADGGSRTHTALRLADFESAASASSATSAQIRLKQFFDARRQT